MRICSRWRSSCSGTSFSNCRLLEEIYKEKKALEERLKRTQRELRAVQAMGFTTIAPPVIVDESLPAPTRTDINDAQIPPEDTKEMHGEEQIDKSVGTDHLLPQQTTPSGPATNSERDKLVHELSFDMSLTWGDIAADVNKVFHGELLDAGSAATAAKRYAEKHGLPRAPKRKAGRKPQGKSKW